MSLNVYCNKVFLHLLMLCYPFQLQLIKTAKWAKYTIYYRGLIHLIVQPDDSLKIFSNTLTCTTKFGNPGTRKCELSHCTTSIKKSY